MKTSILFAVALAIVVPGALDAQVVFSQRTGATGYLGLSFREEVVNTDGRSSQTIRVGQVSKDSPAEKAGMKAEDEILRINGMVATNGKFAAVARTLAEGDTVRLRIRREGRERDITIVAGPRPASMAFSREIVVSSDSIRRLMLKYLDSARVHLDSLRLPNIYIGRDSAISFRLRPGNTDIDSIIVRRDSALTRIFRSRPGDHLRMLPPEEIVEFGELGPGPIIHSIELGARAIGGAELSEMDPALAQYFSGQRGLLTLKVLPETPADRAGLQPGDVILKAKGRSVEKIRELRSIIAANPDGVQLEVSRKGQTRTLELKTRQR